MPVRKPPNHNHVVLHPDGSIRAKGKMHRSTPTGYWEWFRPDGTKLRSGHFKDGEQTGEWTTYDLAGKAGKVTVIKPKTN